jgi:hypothetical protein
MSLVKINGTRRLRKIRTPRDADLAGGVFNFNLYNGSDGSGPGNKIFQTSRNFVVDDKSLIVFKNGIYMYEGTNYQILDSQTVLFIDSINPTDKIALIVNGGTILRDNSATNTFNLNQLAGDLYLSGSSALNNSGNKFFASNYNMQSLTSTFHAVVGTNGTHSSLQQAIDDLPAGSRILLDTGTLNLSSTININKANMTIEGVGRGTVINSSGANIGFNISADGVTIEKMKFQNFSNTAIYVRSEWCMITRNWFNGNTTDIDYSTVSKIVLEANIEE